MTEMWMNKQEVCSLGTAMKESSKGAVKETWWWEPKSSHLKPFRFNFEKQAKLAIQFEENGCGCHGNNASLFKGGWRRYEMNSAEIQRDRVSR